MSAENANLRAVVGGIVIFIVFMAFQLWLMVNSIH
jgi:hypothetical protein